MWDMTAAHETVNKSAPGNNHSWDLVDQLLIVDGHLGSQLPGAVFILKAVPLAEVKLLRRCGHSFLCE